MLLSVLALTGVMALPTSSQFVTPKVIEAGLLKNGYAIITRQIDVPDSGVALIDDLPQASLGTIWFATGTGTEIKKIFTSQTSKTVPADLQSTQGLLAANIGKEVTLTLSTKESLTGKLISASGTLVLISHGGGVTGVNPSQITMVSGTGLSSKGQITSSPKTVLHVELNSPRTGTIYLIDLEPGISWSSAYRLELGADHKLSLTGRAEIVNQNDSLVNAAVSLVSGSPQLDMMGQLDALFLNQPQPGPPVISQYQFRGSAGGGFGGGAPMMKAAADMSVQNSMEVAPESGENLEDLFSYKLKSVTLGKAQTGYYTIIKASLPYEDVYTFKLPDDTDVHQPMNYATGAGMPVIRSSASVWHSIKITNTTGDVLSDGPLEVDKDGLMLCQRSIDYTAKNADLTVPVSIARDITGTQDVEEVSRQTNALALANNRFADLITLKCTIKLKSLHDGPVKVDISRPFSGVMIDAGGADVKATAQGIGQMNPTGTLSWTKTVDSGQEITIVFQYKTYGAVH